MNEFTKWPSIEKLSDVCKHAWRNDTNQLVYRAKVKLHGTNAGVRVPADLTKPVVAQSSSRDLTVEDDNFGFAAWVAAQTWPRHADDYVVFGEWVGPGVQRGVALNLLPTRVFAVFAIQTPTMYITDPDQIALMLPGHHVVPWHGESFEIDFLGRNQTIVDKLNEEVSKIDQQCPWSKTFFDVDGVGEGLVCYPLAVEDLSGWLFKIKGASHAKGGEAPAKIKPATPEGVQAFAEMFVTEARCEQWFKPGSTTSDTGTFIKDLCTDVAKESVNELAAAGLEWKQVNAAVVRAVRTWFLAKVSAT